MPPWPPACVYCIQNSQNPCVCVCVCVHVRVHVCVYCIFYITIISHVYSIILVHQGRESMNALDEGCCFWLCLPCTYVVNVCLFMNIRIIVPCYELILSNCAQRAWYLLNTLTRLGIVWEIYYKVEVTPFLLSPFCSLFMSFLKAFLSVCYTVWLVHQAIL